MFPIRWDFPFRRKDGKLSTIQDEINSGGGGGGGSVVEITPVLTEGTKIADFEIDGEEGSLYAPSGGGGGSLEFRMGQLPAFEMPANNSWSKDVTFADAMPNTNYYVFFGLERNTLNTSTGQGNLFFVRNKTVNGFQIYGYGKESISLVNISWLAIAY